MGNKILAVIGVAFIEGLFCTLTVHLGPGFLAVITIKVAFIQGWPRGVPLYTHAHTNVDCTSFKSRLCRDCDGVLRRGDCSRNSFETTH